MTCVRVLRTGLLLRTLLIAAVLQHNIIVTVAPAATQTLIPQDALLPCGLPDRFPLPPASLCCLCLCGCLLQLQ
jgi:hypothetical protein